MGNGAYSCSRQAYIILNNAKIDFEVFKDPNLHAAHNQSTERANVKGRTIQEFGTTVKVRGCNELARVLMSCLTIIML